MQKCLVEAVGCNAEKEEGQQILEGILEVPHNTSKYMTMAIDRLCMLQVVKTKGLILTTITKTENIQGWKNQKEQTYAVQK